MKRITAKSSASCMRASSMNRFLAVLALAAAAAFSQEDEGIQESHFHNAGIAVRLIGADSILLTVGAGSEDLQNTVGVYPYGDHDTVNFRLFEQRIEGYLENRVPIVVDGRRLYFRVVQWKPDGAGRQDGFDMASLYVQNLYITFGARLPKKRSRLDVTANLWVERRDAAETVVQISLFQEHDVLRRLWTHREKTVRFPLSPDSLKALRANPPPPIQRAAREELGDPGEAGDHSGHDH